MKTLNIPLLVASIFLASCSTKSNETKKISDEVSKLKETYIEVPKDELIANTPQATAIYQNLTSKYTSDLLKLKSAIENNGAKFELVYLTPECGNTATQTQIKGKSIIEKTTNDNNISYNDLTLGIVNQDPLKVTQMPKDGHLSKYGASIISNELLQILAKHKGFMAPTQDNLKSKPAVFGDLNISSDEILDGGKDLPYRMITNSQGLRMTHEVTFPKKKQRVLLFGDSIFFCPFLDNENGIADQLQALYPDSEIINASNWGYSIDDYLSLYNEKAKFLEADVVIVQTSGNDILDYFFSNRLKLSRNPNNVKPSQEEINFYQHLYSKK